MKTVAIAGTGLIGASFGLALKAAGVGVRILGVSSPPALRDALACGAIDEAASFEQAACEADLIYLAQPIGRIIHSLMMLAPLVRPETLVTDAGSTKVAINAAASLLPCGFLGGHPLAGKAERGASAADADLFRGRPYVVTSEPPAEFLGWLEAIGAIPVRMTPEHHDNVVALTSHLPQLASTALAAELHSLGEADLGVSGPGLADMTRLAGSAWDIWADILQTNAGPVSAALDRYIARLQKLRASLPEAGAEFEAGAAVSARVRRPVQ